MTTPNDFPPGNTFHCWRSLVGHVIVGVFGAGEKNLLVLDDGRGFVVANNGSFWIESPDRVQRLLQDRQDELESTRRQLEDVMALAGRR